MKKKKVLLMLGGNIGSIRENFEKALDLIGQKDHCIILKKSGLYKTEPWGYKDQPGFLNQAVLIESSLQPLELIESFQKIESTLGFQKKQKWGERSLDMDIIFYEDWILQIPGLTIPHPLMQERNFVLKPLDEIAPDWEHPVLGQTVHSLLLNSDDEGEVVRIET